MKVRDGKSKKKVKVTGRAKYIITSLVRDEARKRKVVVAHDPRWARHTVVSVARDK